MLFLKWTKPMKNIDEKFFDSLDAKLDVTAGEIITIKAYFVDGANTNRQLDTGINFNRAMFTLE